MVQVLVVVEDLFACRCKVCGVECDHAVALIDAQYGNNCGMWTWCVLREFSRCSWLGECVIVTVCCVVCVIEYGWYVGRGDCGVCGWKDRCRDGNLRTYCHVSPILFGWFFCGSQPYMFLYFCEMLFL